MSEIVEKDKFEKKLQSSAQNLQNCQRQRKLSSCLACKEILECPTRKYYVDAVYENMSKGQGGGFEF